MSGKKSVNTKALVFSLPVNVKIANAGNGYAQPKIISLKRAITGNNRSNSGNS